MKSAQKIQYIMIGVVALVVAAGSGCSTETTTASEGGEGGDGGAGGVTTTSASSETGGAGGGGGVAGSGGGGGVAGSGGQGGTTSAPGPIGALCAVPDDCESGNCAVLNPANNAQGATGFCTFHPCGQDATCGPGGVCRQLSPSVVLNQCVHGCTETADCPAPFVCLPDLGACGVTPK
jgi:hypothetical protein